MSKEPKREEKREKRAERRKKRCEKEDGEHPRASSRGGGKTSYMYREGGTGFRCEEYYDNSKNIETVINISRESIILDKEANTY